MKKTGLDALPDEPDEAASEGLQLSFTPAPKPEVRLPVKPSARGTVPAGERTIPLPGEVPLETEPRRTDSKIARAIGGTVRGFGEMLAPVVQQMGDHPILSTAGILAGGALGGPVGAAFGPMLPQMVRHPIDTLRSIPGQISAPVQSMAQAWESAPGDTGEQVTRALEAGLIPQAVNLGMLAHGGAKTLAGLRARAFPPAPQLGPPAPPTVQPPAWNESPPAVGVPPPGSIGAKPINKGAAPTEPMGPSSMPPYLTTPFEDALLARARNPAPPEPPQPPGPGSMPPYLTTPFEDDLLERARNPAPPKPEPWRIKGRTGDVVDPRTGEVRSGGQTIVDPRTGEILNAQPLVNPTTGEPLDRPVDRAPVADTRRSNYQRVRKFGAPPEEAVPPPTQADLQPTAATSAAAPPTQAEAAPAVAAPTEETAQPQPAAVPPAAAPPEALPVPATARVHVPYPDFRVPEMSEFTKKAVWPTTPGAEGQAAQPRTLDIAQTQSRKPSAPYSAMGPTLDQIKALGKENPGKIATFIRSLSQGEVGGSGLQHLGGWAKSSTSYLANQISRYLTDVPGLESQSVADNELAGRIIEDKASLADQQLYQQRPDLQSAVQRWQMVAGWARSQVSSGALKAKLEIQNYLTHASDPAAAKSFTELVKDAVEQGSSSLEVSEKLKAAYINFKRTGAPITPRLDLARDVYAHNLAKAIVMAPAQELYEKVVNVEDATGQKLLPAEDRRVLSDWWNTAVKGRPSVEDVLTNRAPLVKEINAVSKVVGDKLGLDTSAGNPSRTIASVFNGVAARVLSNPVFALGKHFTMDMTGAIERYGMLGAYGKLAGGLVQRLRLAADPTRWDIYERNGIARPLWDDSVGQGLYGALQKTDRVVFGMATLMDSASKVATFDSHLRRFLAAGVSQAEAEPMASAITHAEQYYPEMESRPIGRIGSIQTMKDLFQMPLVNAKNFALEIAAKPMGREWFSTLQAGGHFALMSSLGYQGWTAMAHTLGFGGHQEPSVQERAITSPIESLTRTYGLGSPRRSR